MARSYSIAEFSASHLGGRAVPDDLRLLLDMQWSNADAFDPLGVCFLLGDQGPTLIGEECSGRNDLSSVERLAHAQAMTDMLRTSAFIAEDKEGGALGYWFGSQHGIDTAPIIRFDRKGVFSILPGHGIAEAILVFASRGDERLFAGLRDQLSRYGLHIIPASIASISLPDCSPTPQAVYEQVLATYRTDLSGTVPPDIGDPAEILAIERGPKIP